MLHSGIPFKLGVQSLFTYIVCLVCACFFILWILCVHSGMHYFIHVFVDMCEAVAGILYCALCH
jgi:uncharacterized membrane protein YccC